MATRKWWKNRRCVRIRQLAGGAVEHLEARVVLSASATVAADVTFDVVPLYVTSDVGGSHTTSPGDHQGFVDHDGVASLKIHRSDGSFLCSGALLTGGAHILTAGHCLANRAGTNITTSVEATFEDDSGTFLASGSVFDIHPSFNGSVTDGYDVAVIALDGVVADAVPRYDIFRDSDPLERRTAKYGYGQSGSGIEGTLPEYGAGTKRWGFNEWNDYGLPVNGINNPETQLTYDFDSGADENDGFNFFFGDPVQPGFGDDEVNAAPGDSGGPSLVDNGSGIPLIAGVTSYGLRLQKTSTGGPPWTRTTTSSDVDGELNSSWGEFSVDANVSALAGFIDSIVNSSQDPSPEPPPSSSEVVVSWIDPSTVPAGTWPATIGGQGFAPGVSVSFANGSGPAPEALNVVFQDSTAISFDLFVKDGGPKRPRDWDVVVTNEDGSSAVLSGGLTIDLSAASPNSVSNASLLSFAHGAMAVVDRALLAMPDELTVAAEADDDENSATNGSTTVADRAINVAAQPLWALATIQDLAIQSYSREDSWGPTAVETSVVSPSADAVGAALDQLLQDPDSDTI